VRKVPVSQAIVGKVSAKTIRSDQGHLALITKGAVITGSIVDALLRRGTTAVWVHDEIFPDVETTEVVSQETRQVLTTALGQIFKAASSTKPVNREQQQNALSNAVQKLVEEVAANDDVVVNIGRVRAWDNYTFEHSVHVATLATVIGKRMLMTDDQLVRLGTGAILHDVGKVTIPQEILQKPGPLTDSEFEVMKTHARNGWDMVHETYQNIMPTSSIVILQHHERLDGSGYPQGLKGDDIYIFSRITAAADVMDAVRAERNYRKSYRPAEVLRIMLQDSGVRLDAKAVEIALRHVSLVSTGEIVRLTNGLLGMVTGLNVGEPLRPVVSIVADDLDRVMPIEEVDLSGTELHIADVLDEWPPVVLEQMKGASGQVPS
jgi:HD-GYP domain-containing protein (c-di-GMP phosphodiesterase class II)